MEVILNKNVDNIGSVGEVIKVRDGFARNFLIPQGFAHVATQSNIKLIERVKAKEIIKEKETKKQAQDLANKIDAMTCDIEMMAGDDGKLFGSVSSQAVQEALAAQGINLDRKQVLLKKPIRKVGSHQVDIRCHTNVRAALKLSVTLKKK